MMLLFLGADTWRKGKNYLYSQHTNMLRLNLPKLEIQKNKNGTHTEKTLS